MQESIIPAELDWINTLQSELYSHLNNDSIFADVMLDQVDNWLQSWHTKLDPTQFRNQYSKKVYRE